MVSELLILRRPRSCSDPSERGEAGKLRARVAPSAETTAEVARTIGTDASTKIGPVVPLDESGDAGRPFALMPVAITDTATPQNGIFPAALSFTSGRVSVAGETAIAAGASASPITTSKPEGIGTAANSGVEKEEEEDVGSGRRAAEMPNAAGEGEAVAAIVEEKVVDGLKEAEGNTL